MTYRTLTAAAVLLPGMCLIGCNKSADYPAEVSGTVTVRGKPLPGGIITFVSEKGYLNSAVIDENGRYAIAAGVGANKIAVDNRLLLKSNSRNATAGPRLKRPEGEAAPAAPTGTYVPIREAYITTEKSGLECNVAPGAQIKDVALE